MAERRWQKGRSRILPPPHTLTSPSFASFLPRQHSFAFPTMASPPVQLWTVGHSTHPLPLFIAGLQQARVAQLVDVRTIPRCVIHVNTASRNASQCRREAHKRTGARADSAV